MEIAVQQLEMCFRQADSDLQHVANKLEIEFEQRFDGKMGPNSNPLKARLRVEALQRDLEQLRKDAAAVTAAQSEYLATCLPLLNKNQEMLDDLSRAVAVERHQPANTAHTLSMIANMQTALST